MNEQIFVGLHEFSQAAINKKIKAHENIHEVKPKMTPDVILSKVSEVCKIDRDDILSASRKRPIVNARYLALYFIRRYTPLSLYEIGKIFNRDHSSALYGINTCEDLIKYDAGIRDASKLIRGLL